MPDNPKKESRRPFVEKWKDSFERTGRLPTAYLFAGPEGSGRGEAAMTIARVLLGQKENLPDLIRLQPEKNTIKIEVIRHLIARLALKPFEGKHQVVLIEGADAMNESAANALLKTLEEPPAGTLFILISARPERLPTTIRSRCQRVVFHLEMEILRRRFAETVSGWQETLLPLLTAPRPSFTQAATMAEQIAKNEPERIASLLDCLRGWWHDLLLWQQTGDRKRLLSPESSELFRHPASGRTVERLLREIDLIDETERAIEGNVNKTLALERLFVKLTCGSGPVAS